MWNRFLGILLAIVSAVCMFFAFLWNLPTFIRDYYRYRRLSRM
jgi:hypothetical protein